MLQDQAKILLSERFSLEYDQQLGYFCYGFNGVNIKCIVFLMVTNQFLFFSWNPCNAKELKVPNRSWKLKYLSELHITNESLCFLCFLRKPNYISLWFYLFRIWVFQDGTTRCGTKNYFLCFLSLKYNPIRL